DDVQRFGMGRAIPINHGILPDLYADGVDDERVALIVTDGVAVPGRGDLRRMRLVHAHMTDLAVVLIEDHDLVARLHDLRRAIRKYERRALEPTLVVRVRIAHAYRAYTVLFHDLRGLRLQNRIRVIADELEAVAGPVRAARTVDERRRPRAKRFKPGFAMGPNARQIRMDSALWLCPN